jgi:hypothetical protein
MAGIRDVWGDRGRSVVVDVTVPKVPTIMNRLFAPTARQLNFLIPVGLLALGYALYVRYLAVEQAWVGLSCEAGLRTWLCFVRHGVIELFKHWVFGWFAVVAAALNLLRPSLVLFSIGMVAAAFGIVLYNIGGSGIAIGLLILSFARPARETV